MSAGPGQPLFKTFRDPAGSLEIRPDGAYRFVRSPEDQELLAFLETPLAHTLVGQNRLVASALVPQEGTDAPPGSLLRHPRVAFPSYPWEWPPSLWLAAAEATLNLCQDLVREGWILKDATPLNVLFQGSQPIFVDVLSVARLDPGRPIWFAYAQFVRMFLLPMLTYARLGWPLRGTLSRRDGYEPEDVYPSLSLATRFTQPALSTVTLPHLLSSRKPASAAAVHPAPADPELTRHVLLKTLARLLKQMRRVTPAAGASTWTDYAETATHYVDQDHARKQTFVAGALDRIKPRSVLDIGCNTGVYSNLAAQAGATVIAVDTDLQTVDLFATRLRASAGQPGSHAARILPLWVDLANPTPAAGWDNLENSSFLQRATGHFDCVLMLAVIHHLLLHNQVPLDRIAALAGALTTRSLIMEWVPPADPKFQELLRGRETLYAHLTEQAFRDAFGRLFFFESELALDNGRILFHLQRK